jgi:hypothetical protein
VNQHHDQNHDQDENPHHDQHPGERGDQAGAETTATETTSPPAPGELGEAGLDLHPVANAAWRGRELGWEELVLLSRQLGPNPAFIDVDDASLVDRVRVQGAQLAAMTCQWLEAIGELVVRGTWADQGAKTPAVWLSWLVGLAPSTARDHVRIALRLRELPQIRDAFAAGQISYSKVRAITRMAVPELQDMLLQWCAHATASDIQRVIAGFAHTRRAIQGDGTARTQRHGLFLSYEDEHTATITIRTSVPEAMALMNDAQRVLEVERGLEAAERQGRKSGPGQLDMASDDLRSESDDSQRRADADPDEDLRDGLSIPFPAASPRPTEALALAEVVAQTLRAAAESGPADTSGSDRTTLVLHVAASAAAATPAGTATPRDGDPVHRRKVARVEDRLGQPHAMNADSLCRLACDAGFVVVLDGPSGEPIDLGRRQRELTASLRRALLSRDRTCRFPGCDASRHLHAHHVVEWGQGGPTDLSNLVLLCSFHHTYVHEHGWQVTPRGDGRFTFAPPGGDVLPSACRIPASWPPELRLVAPDEADDPWSLTGGDAGRIDVDMAVAVIHQELQRVAPVPQAA